MIGHLNLNSSSSENEAPPSSFDQETNGKSQANSFTEIVESPMKEENFEFDNSCKAKFMTIDPFSLGYDKHNVQSCGLIIFQNLNTSKPTEVLCMTRYGRYEFPKGRVEKGENFAETAIRELIEETGCINSDILEINWTNKVLYNQYNLQGKGKRKKTKKKKTQPTKTCYYFFATVPEGKKLEFGEREKATKSVDFLKVHELNVEEFGPRINVYLGLRQFVQQVEKTQNVDDIPMTSSPDNEDSPISDEETDGKSKTKPAARQMEDEIEDQSSDSEPERELTKREKKKLRWEKQKKERIPGGKKSKKNKRNKRGGAACGHRNRDKYSRKLSKLLRHSAKAEGFKVRSDGYIKVKDLFNTQGYEARIEDLEWIVENDDKNRFKLIMEKGKYLIRANQGHSMPGIDASQIFDDIQPGELSMCIHGTYKRFWDSILKNGLNKMSRLHIHFTPSEVVTDDATSGFRSNCNILIYLDVEKALADGIELYRSSNNVILSTGFDGVIPAQYFEKVVNRRDGEIIYSNTDQPMNETIDDSNFDFNLQQRKKCAEEVELEDEMEQCDSERELTKSEKKKLKWEKQEKERKVKDDRGKKSKRDKRNKRGQYENNESSHNQHWSNKSRNDGESKKQAKQKKRVKPMKNRQREKYSKKLFAVLKHKAKKEGLEVRSDGSIKVEDLLNKRGYEATIEDLEWIVNNDRKSKFELIIENEDYFIRLSQGKSKQASNISNETFDPIQPGELSICVHGTSSQLWESVLQSGLEKKNELHIHFTSDEETSGFGDNCDLLIYLDVEKALASNLKLYRSSNNVILSPGFDGIIPAEYFEKVVNLVDGEVIYSNADQMNETEI